MPRARRGRGEGGVHQRADGSWAGVLSLGHDGNGRRKRKWVYAPTKAEVLEKLKALQTRVGHCVDAGRTTVGEHLTHWLENVVKPNTKLATFDRYNQIVRLHLLPTVGGTRLDGFNPASVEALYAELRRAGRGARTIQMCGVVLGTALRNA